MANQPKSNTIYEMLAPTTAGHVGSNIIQSSQITMGTHMRLQNNGAALRSADGVKN
tara:strand:+ start:234 stop:401 length:168 start_codon:yes stop_codon:yes gene_type:complete